MKKYKYCAIFFIIFGIVHTIFSVRLDRFNAAVFQNILINDAVDESLDSAVISIVTAADRDSVTITKEKCVSNFYRTLCACMGFSDDKIMQHRLELYVPVIAFMDEESLAIYHSIIKGNEHVKVWGPEIPYTKTYLENYGTSPNDYVEYVVNFTMTDEITVYTENGVYVGDWEELKKNCKVENSSSHELTYLFSNKDFQDTETFDLVRNSVITKCVTESLTHYTNQHNHVAHKYGEYYTFRFPESAESEIARSVNSVGFMCLFQGYPLGKGTSEVYNRFAISGTRIVHVPQYYVRRVDCYLYYHKESCEIGDFDDIQMYKTKDECAWAGAMPCTECNP